MAAAVAEGGNLIPFVSFVMSEKPIAGLVNEPQLEHPLRCHASHLVVHHERKHLGLLPQCTNICVTTNDKRESSLGKATPDPGRPFSFQVVTVIDPTALQGHSDTKPIFRTALRNLHKRHRDYTDLHHNILFHSTSLPKRERFSWRKEANSTIRSTRCKFRSFNRPLSHHSPKLARQPSKLVDKSNDVKEEISKLVLDEHFVPPTDLPVAAENAVVGASFEEGPAVEAGTQQKIEEPKPEDTSPKIQKRPAGLKLIKKKKKKKKVIPEKKKFNLLKFKQKVPIEGTNYEMEMYLEKEVIDKTRKGKIDPTKEPKINVHYNKVADLRDEFSSYCSERKKLKNWLYYA